MTQTQQPNDLNAMLEAQIGHLPIEDQNSVLKQAVLQYAKQAQDNEINGKITDSISNTDIPDFGDAVNHIGSSIQSEADKYGAEPNIDDTFKTLAIEAINNKMDPAKVIYQFAIQNGYTPKEAQAQVEETKADIANDTGSKNKPMDYVDIASQPNAKNTGEAVKSFDPKEYNKLVQQGKEDEAINLLKS